MECTSVKTGDEGGERKPEEDTRTEDAVVVAFGFEASTQARPCAFLVAPSCDVLE